MLQNDKPLLFLLLDHQVSGKGEKGLRSIKSEKDEVSAFEPKHDVSSVLIAEEQKKDETISLIKHCIREGYKPEKNGASTYLMTYIRRWIHLQINRDQCLTMNWYDKFQKGWKVLLCIPMHLQRDLVLKFHNQAHQSRDKIIYQLRERFYFPGLATLDNRTG